MAGIDVSMALTRRHGTIVSSESFRASSRSPELIASTMLLASPLAVAAS